MPTNGGGEHEVDRYRKPRTRTGGFRQRDGERTMGKGIQGTAHQSESLRQIADVIDVIMKARLYREGV